MHENNYHIDKLRKPKPQREETLGTARLLTFGCYRRKRLLRFEETCSIFLEHFKEQSIKQGVEVWAYVLMPNHVHLLLFASGNSLIRKFIARLKRSAAIETLQWIFENHPQLWDSLLNQKQNPQFWQRGGGYDRSLWSPDKIRQTVGYIHRNPVRSGLVQNPDEYMWSSFNEWESGNHNIINPVNLPVL